MENDRFDYKGRVFPKYKIIEKDGEEFVVFTDEWKEHTEELRLRHFLSRSGVGEVPQYGLATYVGEDKFNNIPKLIKYCDEFKEKFHKVNLYFWSEINSTQKSTCAKDLIVRLAKQGIPCYFVLMDELLSQLMRAERDEEAEARVRQWQYAPFLVLDECFTKGQVTIFSSGYQKAFLNTFLKSRLEQNKLATCFTSNTPIEKIKDVWGDSLQSLVNRNIPTPMFFDDTISVSRFRNSDIWR